MGDMLRGDMRGHAPRGHRLAMPRRAMTCPKESCVCGGEEERRGGAEEEREGGGGGGGRGEERRGGEGGHVRRHAHDTPQGVVLRTRSKETCENMLQGDM